MGRRALKERGFLLVEALAAIVAASVFLGAGLSLFYVCSGLLARSRASLGTEIAASSAIASIMSGESAEGVISSETIYAGGLTLRRVTLQSHDEGTVTVVLPARVFR